MKQIYIRIYTPFSDWQYHTTHIHIGKEIEVLNFSKNNTAKLRQKRNLSDKKGTGIVYSRDSI